LQLLIILGFAMNSNKTVESVKANDLFKGLDFDSLNIPFDAKNFIEFKEGDLIYSSGQPSDFVYLLIDGDVKIKLNAIKRLFFKSPNEYFGETEVLQSESRNSSAVANKDCLIYKIEENLFNKFHNESSSLSAAALPEEKQESIENPVIPPVAEPINETANVYLPMEPEIVSLDTIADTSPQYETAEELNKFELPVEPEKVSLDNLVDNNPRFETTEELNKIELPAEPEKVSLNNFVDIRPKYETTIDLDKIEIPHYEQEPDLDAFIQKKYLENDNKSLKSKLIDDPDDMTNWVITEGSLEEVSGNKNQLSVSEKSNVSDAFSSRSSSTTNSGNEFNYENNSQKISLPRLSGDINKTAKDILEYLLNKTNSQDGAIYLFSQDSQMLEEIYQTNQSIYKSKKSIKEGITALAAKEKEIRYAVSFLNDINFNQEVDRPNDFAGESLIIIPFVDDKKNLLGIAQIGSNETMFTKDEQRKIKEYVSYCSKVLQQSLTSGSKTISVSKSDLYQVSSFIMKDVKAPLLTIKHYSSILSRFDLPEEVKRVISLLSSQATSVIDLLQSSIDFSEKNTKTKLEVVGFNEVMDNNLTLLSDYVESRNVKLFKKLGEDVKIKIDTRKFYVACYYISRFACDMMKQGGNLYFSSQVDDAKVMLTIKDESKIEGNENEQKFFDPSYTGSNGENLGLSLAITKFIIESMNGSINLQPSDSGTSYLVSFPVS